MKDPRITDILKSVAAIADRKNPAKDGVRRVDCYWCKMDVNMELAQKRRDQLLGYLLETSTFFPVLAGLDTDIMDFVNGTDSSISILKAAEGLYPEFTKDGIFMPLPMESTLRRLVGTQGLAYLRMKGLVDNHKESVLYSILKLFVVGELLGFWRLLLPPARGVPGLIPEQDQIRIIYKEPDQGGDALRKCALSSLRTIDEGDVRS